MYLENVVFLLPDIFQPYIDTRKSAYGKYSIFFCSTLSFTSEAREQKLRIVLDCITNNTNRLLLENLMRDFQEVKAVIL